MKPTCAHVFLGGEEISCLSRYGKEFPVSEGESLLRRDLSSRAFFVLTAGRAEISLPGGEGRRLKIGTIEEGSFFGESALVDGGRVAADVIALSPSRVLVCPASKVTEALEACGGLRSKIIAGLVDSYSRAVFSAWRQYQHSRFFARIYGPEERPVELVTRSRAMKEVEERLRLFAFGRAPLLVYGEPGTGKTLLAREIHRLSADADGPLIVVDCRSFCCEDLKKALFGTADGVPGAGGLARGGTLVLRHVDRMTYSAQEALARFMERSEESPGVPSTRFVFTSRRDPFPSTPDHYLHHLLAFAVAGAAIRMPSLRERRRDVLPLARRFLEKCSSKGAFFFNPSAGYALVSRSYAAGNAVELEEVVETATFLTDGPEIGSEHVVAGPKNADLESELDLGRVPMVRSLTSRRAVRGAEVIVAGIFAAVVALSLLGGDTPAGIVANGLVWSAWEPALFAAFFFAGRIWCTACPLSTVSRAARRIASKGMPAPWWMKRHSNWIVAGGFLAVVWAEHRFDMVNNPPAGGALLLVLLLLAIAAAVLFQRETWCRYLCPLGSFGALFSHVAPLKVRTNAGICSSHCTTHDCFGGGGQAGEGCPVFHHPLYVRDSSFCKFCFRCLAVCPHKSAGLYLRAPLAGIWSLPEIGSGLVTFALFIFFFAPFMLASGGSTWMATSGGYALGGLFSLAAAALFHRWLAAVFPKQSRTDPSFVNRISFTLAVMAWGPAMAYQLQRVPWLGDLHLEPHWGTALRAWSPVSEVSVLLVLQVLTILFAAALSHLALWGLVSRAHRDGSFAFHSGWRTVVLISVLYVAVAVLAVIPGGIFF